MKLNASDIARLKPQPKPFKMSNGGDQGAAGLLGIFNQSRLTSE